jgi:hypothetical protein
MRKHMIRTITAITTLAIASLVGCGGSGSGGASTKTGYFIDSAVEGLEYTSGSITGITGTDGSFKYEEGKPVTFKIGSMVLGSLTVTNSKVFPVDLVSGATDETHQNVSLMAQILQSLDSDGVASNGITINETTRRSITQSIAIATADPSQTRTVIRQLLASNTTGTVRTDLVDQTAAESHLESNLIKEYAGNWTGSFTGTGDSGTCEALITDTGSLSGTCTSWALSTALNVGTFTFNGSVSSSGAYTHGSASTGATFSGRYSRNGSVSGTWTNSSFASPLTGTWTMTKQPSSN